MESKKEGKKDNNYKKLAKLPLLLKKIFQILDGI
jgi:hypothetical protein